MGMRGVVSHADGIIAALNPTRSIFEPQCGLSLVKQSPAWCRWPRIETYHLFKSTVLLHYTSF